MLVFQSSGIWPPKQSFKIFYKNNNKIILTEEYLIVHHKMFVIEVKFRVNLFPFRETYLYLLSTIPLLF